MRVEEHQSLTGDARPKLGLCMGLQELAVVAFARRAPAVDGQRVGMQAADGNAQHVERRDLGGWPLYTSDAAENTEGELWVVDGALAKKDDQDSRTRSMDMEREVEGRA